MKPLTDAEAGHKITWFIMLHPTTHSLTATLDQLTTAGISL